MQSHPARHEKPQLSRPPAFYAAKSCHKPGPKPAATRQVGKRGSSPCRKLRQPPVASGKTPVNGHAPLFQARHPPVSGRLYGRRPEGDPGTAAPLSRCLSAAGICFSATLSRQGIPPPLTVGLPPDLRIPAPARRTLGEVPRSARMRPGPGRAPSIPRGRRCPLAIAGSVAAACRLSTAGPCHPGTTIQPGEWE